MANEFATHLMPALPIVTVEQDGIMVTLSPGRADTAADYVAWNVNVSTDERSRAAHGKDWPRLAGLVVAAAFVKLAEQTKKLGLNK